MDLKVAFQTNSEVFIKLPIFIYLLERVFSASELPELKDLEKLFGMCFC